MTTTEPPYMRARRELEERRAEGGAAADPELFKKNVMFSNWPNRQAVGSYHTLCDGVAWAGMTDYEPPGRYGLDPGQVDAIRGLWNDAAVRRLLEAQPGFDPHAPPHDPAPGLPRAQLDLPGFALADGPPAALAPLVPVLEAIEAANRAWWRFDITRVKGSYLRRYRPGQGHRLHTDLGGHAPRAKLGVTAQLSDGDDYEGGALICLPGNVHVSMAEKPRKGTDEYRVPRTRGTIAIWPSWVRHEVQPVESGTRWSLVISVHGDTPFR